MANTMEPTVAPWGIQDKNNFHTCSNQHLGQINPTTPVGKILMETVQKTNPRVILDIGTWNGLGSTRCFLLSLQNMPTTRLISLEVHQDKNILAKENLKDFELREGRADLWWGTVLDEKDLSTVTSVFPQLEYNGEFKEWHAVDMLHLRQAPNVLKNLPMDIDFVLFDGGEFTTYFEFKKLRPRLSNIIAMDDVNVEKCKKIRGMLLDDPEWEEICYIEERNGFSMFKKKHQTIVSKNKID